MFEIKPHKTSTQAEIIGAWNAKGLGNPTNDVVNPECNHNWILPYDHTDDGELVIGFMRCGMCSETMSIGETVMYLLKNRKVDYHYD